MCRCSVQGRAPASVTQRSNAIRKTAIPVSAARRAARRAIEHAPADPPASSPHTRELLGWAPAGPQLIADIAAGAYDPAPVA